MFAHRAVGRPPQDGWCWRATGWARSRCSIPGTAGAWCLAPRSRRLWKAGGHLEGNGSGGAFRLFLLSLRSGAEDHLPQVRKLRPAHYLVVDADRVFAKFPTGTSASTRHAQLSEAEWCEEFLDEFRTAVKSRLVSDVPLGAFLSGGVDSSSVVALMNEFQPPVTTCSIGFSESSYDEAHGRPAVRRQPGREPLRADRAAARDRPGPEAGLALRRAVCRFFGDPDLLRFASRAAACDGGAFRRRRRRELRRLPALQTRPCGKTSCVRWFPRPCGEASLGRWGSVSEAGLGAADRSAPNRHSRAWRRSPIEGYFYGISCLSAGAEEPAAERRCAASN